MSVFVSLFLLVYITFCFLDNRWMNFIEYLHFWSVIDSILILFAIDHFQKFSVFLFFRFITLSKLKVCLFWRLSCVIYCLYLEHSISGFDKGPSLKLLYLLIENTTSIKQYNFNQTTNSTFWLKTHLIKHPIESNTNESNQIPMNQIKTMQG